ncbi:MAG: ribbon-helix-helix domain-containing protein [Candidatus Aminicenantales bacterium]
MSKTAKFAVSMPEAEFKSIEAERQRQKKTRSEFVRDAVRAWRQREGRAGSAGVQALWSSVKEEPGRYGPGTPARETPEPEFPKDIAELRRRAIAAAGSFRSAASDLSVNHDKYLEEGFAATGPADAGGDKKESGAKP